MFEKQFQAFFDKKMAQMMGTAQQSMMILVGKTSVRINYSCN